MAERCGENVEMEDIFRLLYKQFFENLNDEERLPLTKDERELAAFIYPIVEETLQMHLRGNSWLIDIDPNDDLEFEERLRYTRENLKTIILTFSETNVHYQTFIEEFKECEKKRVANIAKLRQLSGAINTDRFNSNISQVTGSSVGAVGSVVLASSLIFPPAALVLGIVGGVVAGLGSVVTLGTAATESILLRNNIRQANAVLDSDVEQFSVVEQWFTDSIQFRAATQMVLSINLMENLARKFRNLKKESSNFAEEFRCRIRDFIADLFANMPITSSRAPLLCVTITTLCVLFVLRKRRHFIYDAITVTNRLFHSFANGLELSVEVTRIIAQIFMRGGVAAVGKLPANVARVVFNGVFAGLGMALDIINIIYTSVDMRRGSRSRRAEKICDAANALEKELNLWRNIYNDLRNTPLKDIHQNNGLGRSCRAATLC